MTDQRPPDKRVVVFLMGVWLAGMAGTAAAQFAIGVGPGFRMDGQPLSWQWVQQQRMRDADEERDWPALGGAPDPLWPQRQYPMLQNQWLADYAAAGIHDDLAARKELLDQLDRLADAFFGRPGRDLMDVARDTEDGFTPSYVMTGRPVDAGYDLLTGFPGGEMRELIDSRYSLAYLRALNLGGWMELSLLTAPADESPDGGAPPEEGADAAGIGGIADLLQLPIGEADESAADANVATPAAFRSGIEFEGILPVLMDPPSEPHTPGVPVRE